jgi:hypothetical protein
MRLYLVKAFTEARAFSRSADGLARLAIREAATVAAGNAPAPRVPVSFGHWAHAYRDAARDAALRASRARADECPLGAGAPAGTSGCRWTPRSRARLRPASANSWTPSRPRRGGRVPVRPSLLLTISRLAEDLIFFIVGVPSRRSDALARLFADAAQEEPHLSWSADMRARHRRPRRSPSRSEGRPYDKDLQLDKEVSARRHGPVRGCGSTAPGCVRAARNDWVIRLSSRRRPRRRRPSARPTIVARRLAPPPQQCRRPGPGGGITHEDLKALDPAVRSRAAASSATPPPVGRAGGTVRAGRRSRPRSS